MEFLKLPGCGVGWHTCVPAVQEALQEQTDLRGNHNRPKVCLAVEALLLPLHGQVLGRFIWLLCIYRRKMIHSISPRMIA